MTKTITVRARGQITIPDKAREEAGWVKEGAVAILSVIANEIKLTPYQSPANWKQVWDNIYKTRKDTGKQGNLSAFIAKDRLSH